MSMRNFMTLAAAVTAAFSAMSTSAADVDFSYAFGDTDVVWEGTSRVDVYDVAIRINDPTLVGAKITDFYVPMVESDNISDVSVWASRELALEKNVNVPDIATVAATVADGAISINFPEPIEIPAEGLYVGYTFTVTAKADDVLHPVALAGSPVYDGLYIHTKKKFMKWKSNAEVYGHSSAISVTIDGDFPASSLGIGSVLDLPLKPAADEVLKATLINYGTEPVNSVAYTVSDGVSVVSGTKEFGQPLSLTYCEPFSLDIPFKAPDVCDEYNLYVSIDKVNGVDNPAISAEYKSSILVIDRWPDNKPLMEEYTGLWCGFCPRGFAALEAMNKRYPDDFVAISYHNGDAMERIKPAEYPSSVGGFPLAWMDRQYESDPYFGIAAEGFGIEQLWKSLSSEFTPAIVEGEAKEDEAGNITVNSKVTFVKTVKGVYKVAYAIIANGLTDPQWAQSNYFAGENPAGYISEMEQFFKGKKNVTGLVFDDVFAAGSNMRGAPDTEISEVVRNQEYTASYSFGPADGMSLLGYDMFANAKDLYAVIVLIDADGKVVNSNKVPVKDHCSGISDSVIDSDNIVASEMYDLSGRRVVAPQKGVYIKVDTDSNGVKTSRKVSLR